MNEKTKEVMPEYLLLWRLSSMVRVLQEGTRYNEWFDWREIYCWEDWGDYVWDLLSDRLYFGLRTRMYDNCDGLGEERQVLVVTDEDYGSVLK